MLSSNIPVSQCLNYVSTESLHDILEKLPRLFQVFLHLFEEEVGLACRLAVTYRSSDIRDRHCPISAELLYKTCTEFGLTITAPKARQFEELQEIYFAPEVAYQQHMDYKENDFFPYEKILEVRSSPLTSVVRRMPRPNTLYIVKEFVTPKKERVGTYMEIFWKEWHILRNINHPNIEQLHGSFSANEYHRYFFVYPTHDMTLQSYFENPSLLVVSGDLGNLLLQWIVDLTSALSYFHGLGGLHRQLEPKHIILKGNIISLSGFNFYSARSSRTVRYDAPEIGKEPYTRRADVYSLAFVLVEILATGYNVFTRFQSIANYQELDFVISRPQHNFFCKRIRQLFETFLKPSGMTTIINLVVDKMLNFDPKGRPATVQALKSIVTAAKSIPPFSSPVPHIDEMEYPSHSETSDIARKALFSLNSIIREGPFIMDQITRDLEENGEELIIDRSKLTLDMLSKLGPFDGPLFKI